MSDEKVELKIEKSPTQNFIAQSSFTNNTIKNKVVNGTKKNHSLDNIKQYSIQDSIIYTSKLKSSVEIKKIYDNFQTLKPILKYTDKSPVEVMKRLKTQGAIRKLKNVNFDSQVEYVEVESLSELTNIMKKNIRQKETMQSKCKCNCIVY